MCPACDMEVDQHGKKEGDMEDDHHGKENGDMEDDHHGIISKTLGI